MRTSKLNCFNEDQDWTNDEIRTILGCVMWQQSQSYLVCVISKKTVVATHENYDSAISSLIVQVICCVWLPVLGRSSTWPIKKKKQIKSGNWTPIKSDGHWWRQWDCSKQSVFSKNSHSIDYWFTIILSEEFAAEQCNALLKFDFHFRMRMMAWRYPLLSHCIVL